MVGEDIYRRPPISFGEKLREFSALNIQDRITKSLLSATNTKNVTEFLVGMMYGTDFHDRLQDVKIEASGSQVLELAYAVEHIVRYGDFRGPALACQLQHLYNKGCIGEVRFGKEYSPVIYIDPPYLTQASNKRLGSPKPYSNAERREMKIEILESLKRLEPDELADTGLVGIRASWD